MAPSSSIEHGCSLTSPPVQGHSVCRGLAGRSRCPSQYQRQREQTGRGPLQLLHFTALLMQSVYEARRRASAGGDGWLFEPKWDGFRAIVFKDGDERLHPEPRPAAAGPLLPRAPRRRCAALPGRSCVDGEIVDRPATAGSTSTRCSMRLHPAESRVASSAAETPRRSSPSTCSPRATTGPAPLPLGRAPRRASRRRSPEARRRSTSRRRPAIARRPRDWFAALRGRRARRRDRQARAAPTSRASARC